MYTRSFLTSSLTFNKISFFKILFLVTCCWSCHFYNVSISVGQLLTPMVNVIEKVGGPNYLIITKTSL